MKKQLIIFFGSAGVFFLFPESARADNCSFFADCFNTAKAAAAAATAMGILAAIASAAADLTPGVGEGKAGIQLVTGYDPITKERVSRWESAIGLIPVFGRVVARGMRIARVAVKAKGAVQTAKVLRAGSRGLSKGIDVYEKIREPYDRVTTVRDTVKDIAGQIRDSMEQSTSKQPTHAETVHHIPSDHFEKILSTSFKAIPSDAPATIAHDTLKDLVKTFGKDSDILKDIVKATHKLENLPKDATMIDVMSKLKEDHG